MFGFSFHIDMHADCKNRNKRGRLYGRKCTYKRILKIRMNTYSADIIMTVVFVGKKLLESLP